MMKDKLTDGKELWVDLIVKLVRLIKDAGSKFVIIQFSDGGYELTEKDFLLTWQINI